MRGRVIRWRGAVTLPPTAMQVRQLCDALRDELGCTPIGADPVWLTGDAAAAVGAIALRQGRFAFHLHKAEGVIQIEAALRGVDVARLKRIVERLGLVDPVVIEDEADL